MLARRASARLDRYDSMTPTPLVGTHVRLEPLTLDHADALAAVAFDPEPWTLSSSPVRTRADLDRYIATALAMQADGTALPFAILDLASRTVVGSTRFAAFVPQHCRVEIGWTWVARPWQRTAVNTEAKWLMMRHAFETLECARVEWKTDVLNTRSRAAIARLGAVQEGVLRSHMTADGGRRRDTVYYSVTAGEWPSVGARLAERLRR